MALLTVKGLALAAVAVAALLGLLVAVPELAAMWRERRSSRGHLSEPPSARRLPDPVDPADHRSRQSSASSAVLGVLGSPDGKPLQWLWPNNSGFLRTKSPTPAADRPVTSVMPSAWRS